MELMIFLEGLDKREEQQAAFQLALIQGGHNPGQVTESPTTGSEEDYSEVEWQTPSEANPAVTMQELQNLIQSNSSITVPSEEGGGWW